MTVSPLYHQHPAMWNRSAEFRPDPTWKRKYPTLNVVGLAKAGTSHLYQILTTHQDAIPFHTRKEFCDPPINPKLMTTTRRRYSVSTQHQVQQILRNFYAALDAPVGEHVVNGCFMTDLVHLHYNYLGTCVAVHLVVPVVELVGWLVGWLV